MKIAVNTRFLLSGKLEGIGWFTHEIFREMVLQHPEHEFIFIFDRAYDKKFIFSENITPIVVGPPARHPILWQIWFNYSIPKVLKKIDADIFISTDGFASLRTKVPQITTIHDLAFEHYPRHLPFKFRSYLRHFTPKFARKVNKIVTVSTFSKQDIERTYGIEREKIKIVYNGAHSQYKPLNADEKTATKMKYAQGKDYFVFAGALHPRKNIEALLDAFALFKKETNASLKLVLIGRFAWKAKGIKEKLNDHPYKKDILNYDYMEVDELSKVIGSAYALTFVSLFEGFGIPILEAIRCNVPGIISNKTSMPEVAGDTALYIEPTNVQDIANKMAIMYTNTALREKLIAQCAAQASKFSWKESANIFWEIIEKEISR